VWNVLCCFIIIFIFTDADGINYEVASAGYSDHPHLFCDSMILSVCPHDKTKTAENKIAKLSTESPSRYLAHQLILGQKVKGQGHRVTKCIMSRDETAVRHRVVAVVTTQLRKTVLLKAIEWSTSVMHSIEQ